MANRNRAAQIDDYVDDSMANNPEDSTQERNVDNIDDIPDELDDEGSTAVPTAVSGNSVGMSLEDLNKMTLDDSRDEEERKKLDPPKGDWIKSERFKFEKRVNTQDSMADDLDSAGRTFFSFSGKPEPRTANGIEYTPTVFFRLSPDIRYKADDPSKVDLSYRLYLKAKDLYLHLNQEKVRNFGQLISMLEEDEYLLNTMVGDNGLLVTDIKPKVQRRR